MKREIKRALVGCALLALMALEAAAGYLLGMRSGSVMTSAPASTAIETVEPLSRFRLEREQLRARQEAQLNEIIYGEKTDAETVALAQSQLLSLMRRSEQEATLEGLLQGRGFEDALVSVGERSANVLVRRETVTQSESAVILDLVMRETGLTGGNVKIIPVK